MPSITITDFLTTGTLVSPEMFGANAVFERTDDGRPTWAYETAAEALGVTNIRFGGGQADLDPRSINVDGALPVDGVDAINIVDMPGGDLRPELVRFLDWVVARDAGGQPTQAVLVIPTKNLSVADYAGFGDQIAVFAQAVMQRYGDAVAAFQIGNEYWTDMGETAYGQKADIAATALARGMEWAGYTDRAQADILVQMATAGNAGSEFGPEVGGGFAARNAAANQQIINQLSAEAQGAIDAVTEHYYYNATDTSFPDDRSDLRHIDQDFAVWEAAFGSGLDLHITEWNIRTTAYEQQGLVAASTLVRQMENMISLGVDAAQIWTLDYHSRTALTLDTDNGPRTDVQGRLTNSANGAVFDLMREALVGKQLLTARLAEGIPDIEVSAYASANEAVIYVSSRRSDTVDVTFDVASALPVAGAVTGVQIELDTSTTNGRQWERGVPVDDALSVGGAPYFHTEHDADVTLRDLWFSSADAVQLRLDPFEVVQLTFQFGDVSPPTSQPTQPGTGTPTPSDPGVPEPIERGALLPVPGSGQVAGTPEVDTIALPIARGEAQVVFNGFGWAEVWSAALSTPVRLTDVERVAFSDGVLALDIYGRAGEAYRLYQASFDRTPDAEGLAFWVGHLDSGAITLLDAAQAFITSPEFESSYGIGVSDADYLTLLYRNVLDRTPDAEGYAFWEAQQAAGLSRADMMVYFSESEENIANVAPQIDDGIWFAG